MKIGRISLKVIGFLALAGLYTYLTMSLWNWIVPVVFKLPSLSFWQTLGLLLLLKFLFLGHGWGKKCHCHKHKHRKKWQKEFRSKMRNQGKTNSSDVK